jgi:hypothetical protein
VSDHFFVAAIAGEELAVGRNLEVYGPVIAFDLVPGAAAHRRHAGEPEDLAARSLQVVPDGLAVDVEELVARDLHVHRALVHELRLTAEPQHPDAIDAMPRTFVAVHQQAGVGRRELQVSQPVRRFEDDLLFAGARVDREHLHRNARLLALEQTDFLRLGEGERFAVLADGLVIRLETRIARSLFQLPVAFREGSQQERLIRVDRRDRAMRDRGDPLRLSAGGLDGEDPDLALLLGSTRVLAAREVDEPRPASDEQRAGLAFDELRVLSRADFDDAEAVAHLDEHEAAIRGDAVLVEVDRSGSRLRGQPHDPVPRGGIDPFGGRRGGSRCGLRALRGRMADERQHRADECEQFRLHVSLGSARPEYEP